MSWITGLMIYGVIWWIGLFAVLPFFARPIAAPDPRTGWRGTPERVRFGRIVLVNSLVALVIWTLCYLAITSDWLSFRHGWLAIDGGDGR
jgi:predicted secreted protein